MIRKTPFLYFAILSLLPFSALSQEELSPDIRFRVRESAKEVLMEFEKYAGLQQFGKLYPAYSRDLGNLLDREVRLFNDLDGSMELGEYLEMDEYLDYLKEEYPNGITTLIEEQEILSIEKVSDGYLYKCRIRKNNSAFSRTEKRAVENSTELDLLIAVNPDFSGAKIVLIAHDDYPPFRPGKPSGLRVTYSETLKGYHIRIDPLEFADTYYFAINDGVPVVSKDPGAFIEGGRYNSKTISVWAVNPEGQKGKKLTLPLERESRFNVFIGPWAGFSPAVILDKNDNLLTSKSTKDFLYRAGISLRGTCRLGDDLIISAGAGFGYTILKLDRYQVSRNIDGFNTPIPVLGFDKIYFRYLMFPVSVGFEYEIRNNLGVYLESVVNMHCITAAGEEEHQGIDGETYSKYPESRFRSPLGLETGIRIKSHSSASGLAYTELGIIVISMNDPVTAVVDRPADLLPGYWSIGFKAGFNFKLFE